MRETNMKNVVVYDVMCLYYRSPQAPTHRHFECEGDLLGVRTW